MNDPRNVKRADTAAMANMFLYAASANLLPVALVQVSRDLSFNLTQGGLLGFVVSVEQFAVLLLSIFLAARFGKILLLRLGMIILAVGLSLITLSSTFVAALLLILFVGFGQGLLEALLTPIVEDLHPADGGKHMNLLHAFWPIGVSVSVVIVGELLSRDVSWRLLFRGLSVVILLASFLYPSRKKLILPKSRTDLSHIKDIFAMPGFWILGFALFFAGGAEGGIAFWTSSYIQIHFGALPRFGAFGAASFAVGMAVGRLLVSRIAAHFSLKSILITSALIAAVLSGGFLLIPSLWFLLGFLFVMGLFIACFWPSIQSFAAIALPVDPTVVMIFLSCFGIPGYSSATLIMGFLGDRFGLQPGFLLIPIYCLGLVTMLLISGWVLPKQDNGESAEVSPS